MAISSYQKPQNKTLPVAIAALTGGPLAAGATLLSENNPAIGRAISLRSQFSGGNPGYEDVLEEGAGGEAPVTGLSADPYGGLPITDQMTAQDALSRRKRMLLYGQGI